MNSAKVEIETVLANAAERVRAIRFRLPGQAVMERIELARVAYGPLYTIGLIQERVAETLPIRIGYVRSTVMEPIEQYSGLIPDEVLLKYDDAERSGLFAKFWVVTPTYYRAPPGRPVDRGRGRRDHALGGHRTVGRRVVSATGTLPT
jgi:hypothetical protein